MTLYQYTGTGSISNSSNLIGKKSFSYTLNSVVDNTPEDYQLITNSFTSSDNYGEVTQLSGQTLDYFSITETPLSTLIPFGGIILGGSAITQPNYRLYFSGAAVEKAIYSPDNTSGTLFSFGEKVEKRTYDYNESSSENTEEDFGLITQIFDQQDDYQLITFSSGTTEEYGFITEQTGGTVTPFGSLTFSGSAITQPNYRLYFSGAAVEKAIYSPDNTSGTLFSFGEKIERVTFDYSETSIYETIDDYGLISSLNPGIIDYGSITDNGGAQPQDNYGLITEVILGQSVTPFGTLTFNGSAVTAVENTYTPIISGSISYFGTAVEKFVANTPENVQLLEISGNSSNKHINSYVTGGTLFSFGEKVERRTYNYNLSSFSGIAEDYQLITSSPTEFEEFGFINSAIDNGTDDYGRVGGLSGGSTPPFGTIVLSGSSTISFDKGAYSASGIITVSGTALEALSAQTPENTQLFQISGTALDSSINVHVGIGTLLKFGEKIERRTYDYNETSIVLYDTLDYQSITSIPNEFDDDYGLVINLADGIEDYGFLVGFGATESLYPFGSIFISGSASDIKETDAYQGLGTIFVSGTALEKDVDSYVGLGTIFVSDIGIEKEVDSYVGLGTIFVSGTVLESFTESTYVGSGVITLSGTAVEKFTGNTPENTQLFQISGTVVEKDVDSYVGLGTITLSGELVHPNIDYTPHYGIEKNIGIGTTGIQISGTLLESFAEAPYVGSGVITLSGTALEALSAQTPENTQLFQISGTAVEKDVDSYVGLGTVSISGNKVEKDVDSYVGLGTIFVSGVVNDSAQRTAKGTGTIFINGLGSESRTIFIPILGIGTGFIGGSISISSGIAQTHYYSPIYPRNSGVVGSGIGTIRLNDDSGLTITRAVLPYFSKGGIVLSNTGKESFTKTNYNGSGLITLSGISSTREIAVYTEVGFGTITLSAASVIKDTESYQSSGVIYLGKHEVITQALNDSSLTFDNDTVRFNNSTSQFVYSEAYTTETDAYRGTGRINVLRGASESFVLQSTENTQLFTISGSAADAYSAQTPETEVLYQFSGNITESRTYGYEGSGQATFGSAAIGIFEPRVFGTGLIRFATHLSDNLYDTCDSENVTSDNQISAFVKFVSNPPENTVLYNFSGSASTAEIQLYRYSGLGSVGISGSHLIRKTKSVVGIGTLTIASSAVKKDIDSYVGSGIISVLSGFAESKVSVIPQSTVLFNISGVSSTRTFKVKTYSGVGTAYFSGSASTRVLSSHSYSGVGTIYLSGELVHPNIKFIPVVKTVGGIGINGFGVEKIRYEYFTTSQVLYVFSGGFESFTKTGYTGIGTIYIQPTSSSTINNPYQPPRVYVTII